MQEAESGLAASYAKYYSSYLLNWKDELEFEKLICNVWWPSWLILEFRELMESGENWESNEPKLESI